MSEDENYENFKKIITTPGEKKVDAIAFYLKSKIDDGTISWVDGLTPPSLKRLQDVASYMAPVFTTVSPEEAEQILNGRTLLFLVGIMRDTLRELGGWTEQDRRVGIRMV